MAEAGGERTHDASSEGIRRAEEAGDFAVSREVATAAAFVGGAVLLWALHSRLWTVLESCARDYFAFTRHWQIASPTAAPLLWSVLIYMARLCWPLLLAAAALAFLANVCQTGGLRVSPRKEFFNPGKLDQVAGMAWLLAPMQLFEGVKAFLKAILFTTICYQAIRKNLDRILALGSASPKQALETTISIALQIFVWAAVFLVVLAVVDYGIQRFHHRRRLRMSAQEVEAEQRELEGNRQIKRRQRAKQMEYSRNRGNASLRRASVVIVNPTEYAVALRHDSSAGGAPRLEAKAERLSIQGMKDDARRRGIPVVENRFVARMIYFNVKTGQEIPRTLYRPVAEILAHVRSLGAPSL